MTDDTRGSELHQYLTFTLGQELFALDIGSVKEILDDTDMTRIPRMPEAMRGVINVRGHAMPVVDLRLAFGMTATEMTQDTCVIITEMRDQEGSDEITYVGALADSVQEVVEINPDQIDPPPRMGTRVDVRFIRGMAKKDATFIIILDIDTVFQAEKLTMAVNAAQDTPPESVDKPVEDQVPA